MTSCIKSYGPRSVKKNFQPRHHYHEKTNINLNSAITLADIIQLVTVTKIEKQGSGYLIHIEGHNTPVSLNIRELMSRRLFQLRVFQATLRPPHIQASELQWLLALGNALKENRTGINA